MSEVNHINGARNTIDPSQITTLSGILSELSRVTALNIQCCIPAMVIRHDRKTHIATVKPLVRLPYDDIHNHEQSLEMPQLDITVWRLSIGGFLIDMPLFQGDTGWIVASDWNTTNIKMENSFGGSASNNTKNAGPKKPNTYDIHRYKNGFFIPDRWGDIDIAEEDSTCLVIKSLNGDTYISISQEGNVSIKNPNGKAVVNIQGSLNVSGTTQVGKLLSNNEVTAFSKGSAVSLSTHKHTSGAQGSPTSAPIT